jgi:hypothetical protein
MMASPGHAATHAPHPVHAASSTMGCGGNPIRGRKRIAETEHASPQERQTIPASAKQQSLMMATGLDRS